MSTVLNVVAITYAGIGAVVWLWSVLDHMTHPDPETKFNAPHALCVLPFVLLFWLPVSIIYALRNR